MSLFYWPLFISILVVVGFAQVATPVLEQKHASSFAEHTLPVHKTLYLERGIYDEEVFSIMEAASEWYDDTNGQVVFDIKMLPRLNINPSNAVVMFNVTPDFPEVILLDNVNQHSTMGCTNRDAFLPYIWFVDERIESSQYQAVAMHEMGHVLGMDHIEGWEGIFTLMYPSADLGSNHITETDLKYFCKLYHCDPSKFHVIH
jgi:hypothetical protein